MATHDINVNGTIANDAVTNAKLANAPEATFKLVPVGSGTSNPIDGDADQAMEILALATDPPLTAADLAGYVQDGQTLSTGLVFPYGGLRVKDNAGSQELAIVVGEDLTANRTLTLIVNDANKTLELTGDAEVEGVNTGDQDLSGLLTEADADLLYDALGAAAAAQAASQPLDADLTAIAELTPSNDDIIQRKAGAWTNRSMSQLATDLAGGIRSTLLTGLSLASSAAVAATDSILEAFGKLQAFNNLFTTAGLAIARLANPGAVTFLRINADNTATARTAAEMRSDLDVSRELASITSNFTTSSGTYVDITGLAVTLEANSVYQVTMLTPYQSPALATGAGVSITMTGSPTLRNASRTMFTTGSVAGTTTSNTDDNHNINTTISPANATLGCVMIMSVMTSGSACTIQGRAARGGTAGTITIMAGSSISALKIS